MLTAGLSKLVSGMLSKGLQIGTNFGKLGTVVGEQGLSANSMTAHAAKRAAERGLSESVISQTVSKPLATLQQAENKFLCISKEAAVVVTKDGKIITVYSKSEFDSVISGIVNQASKGVTGASTTGGTTTGSSNTTEVK